LKGLLITPQSWPFLIRYGKPQIDEPLSDAYERCAQSAAWKDCCDEFKFLLPRHEYLRR
jgi:hypothetical protein